MLDSRFAFTSARRSNCLDLIQSGSPWTGGRGRLTSNANGERRAEVTDPVRGYDEGADALAARYEGVRAEDVHSAFLDMLPARIVSPLISGRDRAVTRPGCVGLVSRWWRSKPARRLARCAPSTLPGWARSASRRRSPPASSSGGGCTSGWDSCRTGSTPQPGQGARRGPCAHPHAHGL